MLATLHNAAQQSRTGFQCGFLQNLKLGKANNRPGMTAWVTS